MAHSSDAPAPRTHRPVTRLAWIVAVAADVIQIVAMPFFGEGALSPVNDVLDVVVSIVLFRLLGWHPALLPALAAELIPGVDLVPTWTAAVAVVAFTRRGGSTPHPAAPTASTSHAEVLDEPAAPPRGPDGGAKP